jgi:hypothetical protein
MRQKKSKSALEVLKQLIDKINAPPQKTLGKAVTYCKN